MNQQLEFLDILTILSFVLQIQNQSSIVSINDVQDEVNRAITEIHAHLEEQDRKLEKLLERMGENENH